MQSQRHYLFAIAITLVVALNSAHAVENADVTRAVERGVTYLKSVQGQDGKWPYGQIGCTALAALTLLECDVPATDPAIAKALMAVRDASVDLNHTYSVALAIILLDRVGDPADVPLIESLAARLLAAQTAQGGWGYSTPNVPDDEVKRLRGIIAKPVELVARKEPPTTKPGVRRTPSKEVMSLMQALARTNGRGMMGDDNSNTQFATLALWVARRQGMPVDRALAGVESRFRQSQNGDGGWSYKPLSPGIPIGRPIMGSSTTSMTCAGLLALAVGQGSTIMLRSEAAAKNNTKPPPTHDPAADPAVRAALTVLGASMRGAAVPRGSNFGNGGNDPEFYYLWSLERVSVAYGFATIARIDWYDWGGRQLLPSQHEDGSWTGGTVNTCFALLFLRRANFAQDLSLTLGKQTGDPVEVSLKGGELPKQIRPLERGDNPDQRSRAAPVDEETSRLAAEVVASTAEKREAILTKLRDARGTVYTEAIAVAITSLEGTERQKARDMLAERLAHMQAETLRDKLHDERSEVRAAAALACAMKDDITHVPDLVPLLDDSEKRVGKAALAALKSLSNQDFGTDGTRWRTWWKDHGKKP